MSALSSPETLREEVVRGINELGHYSGTNAVCFSPTMPDYLIQALGLIKADHIISLEVTVGKQPDPFEAVSFRVTTVNTRLKIQAAPALKKQDDLPDVTIPDPTNITLNAYSQLRLLDSLNRFFTPRVKYPDQVSGSYLDRSKVEPI